MSLFNQFYYLLRQYSLRRNLKDVCRIRANYSRFGAFEGKPPRSPSAVPAHAPRTADTIVHNFGTESGGKNFYTELTYMNNEIKAFDTGCLKKTNVGGGTTSIAQKSTSAKNSCKKGKKGKGKGKGKKKISSICKKALERRKKKMKKQAKQCKKKAKKSKGKKGGACKTKKKKANPCKPKKKKANPCKPKKKKADPCKPKKKKANPCKPKKKKANPCKPKKKANPCKPKKKKANPCKPKKKKANPCKPKKKKANPCKPKKKKANPCKPKKAKKSKCKPKKVKKTKSASKSVGKCKPGKKHYSKKASPPKKTKKGAANQGGCARGKLKVMGPVGPSTKSKGKKGKAKKAKAKKAKAKKGKGKKGAGKKGAGKKSACKKAAKGKKGGGKGKKNKCKPKPVNLAAVVLQKGKFTMQKRPMPKISAPDDVIIAIDCVGLCTHALKLLKDGKIGPHCLKKPLVLGHEASGIIKQVGKGVKKLKKGDRVAIEPGVPCGRCTHCRCGHYNLCKRLQFLSIPPKDGNMTNFYKHKANYCLKIPDSVTMEEGAFLEPLATGVAACRRARVKIGHSVLIIGAGPVGMAAMMSAQALGASKIVVTDVRPDRLELAEALGATCTVQACGKKEKLDKLVKRIHAAFCGKPNRTIECSGAKDAAKMGIVATGSGGVVALVGDGPSAISVPQLSFTDREVDLVGVRGYLCNDFKAALAIAESGNFCLKSLISHHFMLKDTAKALRCLEANKPGIMKIMIHAQDREKNNPCKFTQPKCI